jgi:hypothetical protein
MSNKNKKDGISVRIILLERKDDAASQHYSCSYDLTNECDLTLLPDDIRRIIGDPQNASKLDCFVPGMSE